MVVLPRGGADSLPRVLFAVSTVELAVLVLTVGLVIAAEMFNTVLEVVDLITEEYHPLAKTAKNVRRQCLDDRCSGIVGFAFLTR